MDRDSPAPGGRATRLCTPACGVEVIWTPSSGARIAAPEPPLFHFRLRAQVEDLRFP